MHDNITSMDRRILLGAAGLAGAAAISRLGKAGPLDPPSGSVVPTGHTTNELWRKVARTDAGIAEPRTPVQSLAGSATAQYVINQPGNYYLTDNVVGTSGLHGIVITASDVRLDLSGFSLTGVGGALTAIYVPSPVSRVNIANGRVSDWPCPEPFTAAIGLSLATAAVVSDVVVEGSGRFGIHVGPSGFVAGCVGRSNGFSSFFLQGNSALRSCASFASGSLDAAYTGGAFCLTGGGIIEDFLSVGDRVGVRVEDTGVVSGCRIINAGTFGVRAGSKVQIRANQMQNCSAGIECYQQCHVSENWISNCSGQAISVPGGSSKVRIEENHIIECNGGIQIASPATGCFVARNSVNVYAGVPYAIATGNAYGPIVNIAGAGAISAVANANHPWANFIY